MRPRRNDADQIVVAPRIRINVRAAHSHLRRVRPRSTQRPPSSGPRVSRPQSSSAECPLAHRALADLDCFFTSRTAQAFVAHVRGVNPPYSRATLHSSIKSSCGASELGGIISAVEPECASFIDSAPDSSFLHLDDSGPVKRGSHHAFPNLSLANVRGDVYGNTGALDRA